MTDKVEEPANKKIQFSFLKGDEDVIEPKDGQEFDWQQSATKVREQLHDAMNAKNVAFLLGSGCSSFLNGDQQLGIPTMKPMAEVFAGTADEGDNSYRATEAEKAMLRGRLGLDITDNEYTDNLERLMEVLFNFEFVLKRSNNDDLKKSAETIATIIGKVTRYILRCCTEGPFANGDETVCNLYQTFYRKLIYRDRALPRPWVFTTNYDLFSETAMDRLGIPYCNGFSGTVERRFNPATFRYSLAEQLDISSRKWTAVDNFVYLAKLHGSISWIEHSKGLFPIRELQQPSADNDERVMIYPTPAKQTASFGSPYSDLFREFQSRIVRDQSVLFIVGYGFGDEHINNIIFQALTVPTFRMVAFLPPAAEGVAAELRQLADPRIWIIGGDGPAETGKAHYFDTFVQEFMPETPSDRVDTAVEKALQLLLTKDADHEEEGEDDAV